MIGHQSWGRYPAARQHAHTLHWTDAAWPCPAGEAGTLLPFGRGHSYGDVCLNDGGTVLDTRGLDRFMAFDRTTGIVRCEAGVTLGDVLAVAVPAGWFLPVTPGTRYVTLGGAIANDVHGKNHHRAGTLGRHVRCFELLRSDGSRRLCSREENVEWFRASIGGLGLTGLITWAEIALTPIAGSLLEVETIPFPDLDAFLALNAVSDRSHEHTVAWVDALAGGPRRGRGVFFRGNHTDRGALTAPALVPRLGVPVTPPFALTIGPAVRAFNSLYHRVQCLRAGQRLQPYASFFYPLDAIGHWNRLYGPRGLLQYQCVVPHAAAREAIGAILETTARQGEGSFLAVMKAFGDQPAEGLLSFARPGVTLALDFAHRGRRTLRLLERLDSIVEAAAGALNPSKDARMPPAMFQRCFPGWQTLENLRDPHFSSGFWRRLTPTAP